MARVFRNFEELESFVKQERGKGRKIVFTNGCFDIVHAGHVDYLEKAKAFGDVLIVGINSDSSIKRIKGEKRPVVPQDYRVRVLLGLRAVDGVVVFDDDTPLEVIKLIKPDVLVKGADWPVEKIVGREYAGKVERVKFIYDISTSKIVNKIVEIYCGKKVED
ncbi:D-glycero-beta-D-manno-heptose 1-phosphate adenylyltransferase [Desulfurobacterium atlanticum]|uniref:D-glycero-beta-D-manno-heptose 1-phosphate adenylyltransferase n=1 Tax=Desulfurobacterium atlanticum TaxID=240169 RepID=A0A238XQT5_9BACT|nr:D-glycero-beta-D-manno-heptose 1-phosphate adenylyltransferase [Desulfurobacterium atlanticum]SNR61307.1 rfaE bifunctional protein, domain II [Desulfurobacterium atlanticum]